MAWPWTLVTWQWLRLSMMYCCALRLTSEICVTCQSCWFPDSVILSSCAEASCLGLEGWLHTYEIVTEHFAKHEFDCGCSEIMVFRVWGVRQNLHYRNPDLDDRIFDCFDQCLPCRLRMSVPLSCLWVVWMAIIRSGWVLRPRTVMELQPLTS